MKLFSRFIVSCLFLALALTGCQDKQSIPFEAGPDQGPGLAGAGANRWIVIFDNDTYVNTPAREALIKKFGESLKEIDLVNGVVVYLPPQAVAALGKEVGVVRVDPDVVVHAVPKPAKPGKPDKPGKPPKEPEEPPPQELPWGVNRIDAEYAWDTSTGSGIRVAILDTGIDLAHPDLLVVDGYNAINSRKSARDDNGHGTHVAGTVAALDNDSGVVGVAPGASLYAVKVLDRRGSGFLSDVIAGIDWCITNEMQVINMSLGTSSDVLIFQEAITAASDAGITLVAAAGNHREGEPESVIYPAAYGETIAVSATDANDGLAGFSNWGEEIDFAAPGVDILSTWKGGGYDTESGTSMAAPHVTGTVALILQAGGSLVGENIGLDPSEQGAGLVDAEKSVTGVSNGDN